MQSLTQVSIVKMLYGMPNISVGEAALGDETVDIRVPFQRTAKGMEDAGEARDKVL